MTHFNLHVTDNEMCWFDRKIVFSQFFNTWNTEIFIICISNTIQGAVLGTFAFVIFINDLWSLHAENVSVIKNTGDQAWTYVTKQETTQIDNERYLSPVHCKLYDI